MLPFFTLRSFAAAISTSSFALNLPFTASVLFSVAAPVTPRVPVIDVLPPTVRFLLVARVTLLLNVDSPLTVSVLFNVAAPVKVAAPVNVVVPVTERLAPILASLPTAKLFPVAIVTSSLKVEVL